MPADAVLDGASIVSDGWGAELAMPNGRHASIGTLALVLLVGCVRLDESHCANRNGDASCAERGDALAVCSECVASHDGCVAGPIAPECHAAGTTDGSESANVADDAATQDPTDDPSASSSQPSAGEGSAGEGSAGEESTASTNAVDDTSASDDTTSDGATTEVSEGSASTDSSTTMAEAECGNDIREADEQCDGIDLDGQTCLNLPDGAGGTLSCDQSCMFNTTQCNDCLPLLGLCAVDSQCCVGHCNLGLCVL